MVAFANGINSRSGLLKYHALGLCGRNLTAAPYIPKPPQLWSIQCSAQ
jgi:hypothetical protein